MIFCGSVDFIMFLVYYANSEKWFNNFYFSYSSIGLAPLITGFSPKSFSTAANQNDRGFYKPTSPNLFFYL